MIRRKKVDFNFLKKIFVLILALMIGLTSVPQYIYAQENLLGIESYINYSDDAQNGTIYLDLQNVDNNNYEIKEILDPQMNQLSMEALEYVVTANGDYTFTVEYIERNQEELIDEKDDDNGIDAALLIDDLQTEEEIKTYELVVAVDKIIESNTVTDEITVESNADEDESIKPDVPQNIHAQENLLGTHSEFSGYAARGTSNIKLEEIFDADNLMVNKETHMNNATNVNGKVEGNQIVLYDPEPKGDGVETPTNIWAGYAWWQTSTTVTAKSRLSLKNDWEFVYTFQGTPVGKNQGNRGSIYLWFGDDPQANNDVEISAMADGRDAGSSKLFIWDRGTSEREPGDDKNDKIEILQNNASFFAEKKKITVKCDYDSTDGEKGAANISISCEGKTVERKYRIGTGVIGDSVILAFGGDATWGYTGAIEENYKEQNNYPEGTVVVTFESLSYLHLNPVIDSIKWYRKSEPNIELTDNSAVSPGEALNVKVSVRNDSTENETFDATLFPSDDPAQALTHGIDFPDVTGGLMKGIPVNLGNTATDIVFDVDVMDTIGDISLGVSLEDDFFHSKKYLEKRTKISIGHIFAESFPKYTISNPQRDGTGKVVKVDNELVFAPDSNQDQLNQDSYVKFDINLKNPRENEDMGIVMKADTSKALGLDLDTVHGLVTSDNITITKENIVEFLNGTDEESRKLRFTLPKNDTAMISFYVPVKQKSGEGVAEEEKGKPADTGAQEIKYTIEGTITVGGKEANGSWEEDSKIKGSIIDIDADLTTDIIKLKRDQEFDLFTTSEPKLLTFKPVTEGSGVTVDFENVNIKNQGTLPDWKCFGLEDEFDSAGKVALFAEDDKTLSVDVAYNGILNRDGVKHYTRSGNEVDVQRTRSKTITLKVVPGEPVVTPYAFFEIPKSVYLNDWKGIDDAHAGIQAEVKLIDDVVSNYTFTIEADNDFLITNSSTGKSLKVNLYDENKDSYGSASRVNLGEIDDTNRSKTVWYNLVKDPSLAPGEHFTGTMQFYITKN